MTTRGGFGDVGEGDGDGDEDDDDELRDAASGDSQPLIMIGATCVIVVLICVACVLCASPSAA